VQKSHFPIESRPCQFQKAIVLVRNPLDVMVSYFNYVVTMSHTNTEVEEHPYLENWFEVFVRKYLPLWQDFYVYWMQQSEVPTHLIRFEDVLADPEPTLRSTLEFIFDVPTIKGTRLEMYLNTTVSQAVPVSYKPRQGRFGKNKAKYDPELLQVVKEAGGFIFSDLFPALFEEEPSYDTYHVVDGEVQEPETDYTPKVDLQEFKETQAVKSATKIEPLKLSAKYHEQAE